MPDTCPATRAPIPQPNPRIEMTGSMIGATRFIFQTRRCTTTFRRQTASASRRSTFPIARVVDTFRLRLSVPLEIGQNRMLWEWLSHTDARQVYDLPKISD